MVAYDESLSYDIGAIFLIFCVSLLGFFLPYIMVNHGFHDLETNIYFLNLKSFASGIILSVAMVHLLADATSTLYGYLDYPCKYQFKFTVT